MIVSFAKRYLGAVVLAAGARGRRRPRDGAETSGRPS